MLAVTARRINTVTLVAVSRAALEAGVRAGMTLSQALAIVPQLESEPQNEHDEIKALQDIAEVGYGLAPKVGLIPPQTLILDVTGCERLHGSESGLAEKLHTAVIHAGYTPRIALADHAGPALLVARSPGRDMEVLGTGAGTESLRDLPLGPLRMESGLERQLESLGIVRVGQLLGLPRSALPARFGDGLSRLLRQLRGEEDVPAQSWVPGQLIRERVDFSGPTNRRDVLEEALKQAAGQVSRKLGAAAKGATDLAATLFAADSNSISFSTTLAVPRIDAKSLTTVLLNRFETIDTGESWFDGVELAVQRSEKTPELQQELFAADAAETWRSEIAATVDELVGRLGVDAAMRTELTSHPVPQESFRYVRWGDKPVKSKPHGPSPVLPARVPWTDYKTIGEPAPLPALWDFAGGAGILKVIRSNVRFDFHEARDYLRIEDEAGQRHLVWRAADGWHVPPSLSHRAPDFAALDACGLAPENQGHKYAELACATNFSFLRGASGPATVVEAAAKRGLHAVAIADRHTLAGVVRAHARATELNIKLLIGTRLPLRDGPDLCLYAMNRAGYGNICRLLTLGKLRTVKGDCELFLADLAAHAEGLQVVVMNAERLSSEQLEALNGLYRGRLSLALGRYFEFDDDLRARSVGLASRALGIPVVAINDVHSCEPEDHILQSIVMCIREGTTLTEGAGIVFPNGERRLKTPAEMHVLFRAMPEALARSVEIANACAFSMGELAYEYPEEIVPKGVGMQAYLEQEATRGAERRYPGGVPEKVLAQIKHELELIDEKHYAAYFLTIYDIVNFAKGQKILCQGRGSAANSAVCYCLGVTEVPPHQGALLFERFISKERNEPPDIDVDFEHERREEVIQYIYAKYGRERAGICSTVITYRFRSAVRDVGKVLGLSIDQVDRLAKSSEWWDKLQRARRTIRESGLNIADRQADALVYLVGLLLNSPRHLSQHVGGFVITRTRLDELVPIENAAMEGRTFIEWNKDDIDALRILKVDCLALGMLTALRKAFALIGSSGGGTLTREGILACDPTLKGETPQALQVYRMLQKADAVGTFQVESRAQMAMLPRLKPKRFYDLVIEVAIVRPGPIQGGMVHPYLRRRDGKEAIDYIYPKLESVLKETLGVPLFQEQAMQIAMVAANYTAGEADQLRRAMGSWRNDGVIVRHHEKLVGGMLANGISQQNAERVYKQIEGFASYGFPEAHAASFALITFVSAFLKRFYPAAFTAALINSQPMGFYSASSLVRDAREHGVKVLAPCVNASDFDCTLERIGRYDAAVLDAPPAAWGATGPALRLGFCQVRGISEALGKAVEKARHDSGPFQNLDNFVARLDGQNLPPAQRYRLLVQLASADAFAALGLDRRAALWEVAALRRRSPHLFGEQVRPVRVGLPPMSAYEHMIEDHEILELSLRAHPMEFVRDEEKAKGVIAAMELRDSPHGRKAEIAGRIINRQHPQTANGIVFMTLEDETDVANIVVKPEVFERYRKVAVGANMVAIRGRVERVGDVVHLVANSFRSLMARFADLRTSSRDFH